MEDLSSDESDSMRTNNMGHRKQNYTEDEFEPLTEKGYFEGIDGRWKNEDLSHAIEIFILRYEYLCDK